ncbi:MAG: hypothetical protein JO249_01170 [Acidobacteria bacterium]|nr:hypothetical protein [Acidobacteriota bacterium]MBV9479349.1 hypothetical protein [Acidobacteriota bacterium]
MTNLSNVVKQLRKQREHTQGQLEQLRQAISALEGLAVGRNGVSPTQSVRNISPAARRRIAAAQKARWAKWRQQHGEVRQNISKAPSKRTFSAATRRKMAAAQKARWAKAA